MSSSFILELVQRIENLFKLNKSCSHHFDYERIIEIVTAYTKEKVHDGSLLDRDQECLKLKLMVS
jgi:hypothetical protein